MASKPSCFVIMPFSKSSEKHSQTYWDGHYTQFLEPLIKSTGCDVHRSKALSGDILKGIITDLINSDIVVADLTDANSNVYWELGVRQSFKHGTITISEYGTFLPFDLTHKGTLFYYPEDHIQNSIFEKDFVSLIKDCINNDYLIDSPILEYITGRGSIYNIIKKEENIRRLEGLISETTNNSNLLIRIIESIERKDSLLITYFRNTSVGNLITNRYLEGYRMIYMKSEAYYDLIETLNARLLKWSENTTLFEEWISTRCDKILDYFNEYLAILWDLMNELKRESTI